MKGGIESFGMRNQLYELNNIRTSFLAEVIRLGKTNDNKKTILVRRVTTIDNNKIVAQHLWLKETDNIFSNIELKAGIYIKFDATVQEYCKDNSSEVDYCLIDISDVSIVKVSDILL